MVFNATALAAWGAGTFASNTLVNFANPAAEFKPKIRWWWVHGTAKPAEVRLEIDQMHAAGFGGFEVQDVHHSITTGTVLGDLSQEGWGGPKWLEAYTAALEQASSRGMTRDTGISPAWPFGVPTYGADDVPAAKEIAGGQAFVSSGSKYSGAIPSARAKTPSGVTNSTVIAVQAWRVNSASSSTANPIILDQGTKVDLEPYVTNGNIDWTPPDNATWMIFSARIRGTGQQPEDYPHTDPLTWVADHFSKAGSQAVTDYWDKTILGSTISGLLKEKVTALMEDSLELVSNGHWTHDFAAEFVKRRGYNVTDMLPVVVQSSNKFYIALNDTDATRAVQNDYWDTLSDLYVEYHAKQLQSWAVSRGLTMRTQPYGAFPLDGMRAAAVGGIGEGESLGFEKSIDNYRALSGALGMANKKILSNELGAYTKSAYGVSWATILRTVNPQWAAGVTQNVVHGFSYIDAPGATWPGWAAFTPQRGSVSYSESWGPRHPTWRHANDFTSYMARMQYITQQGVPKHDAAIFRRNGAVDNNYCGPYFTSTGAKIGWSANYVNPGLLRLCNGAVRDGRLAPTAANYSLLVVPQDPASGAGATLTPATASRLLKNAKAGLPILFIGDWSSPRSYGYGGLNSGLDALVKEAIESMAKLSNVVTVATEADIPAGIEKLGVSPAVSYSSSNLVHIRREDGDVDNYVFSVNSSSAGISQTVTIPRRNSAGVPVFINAWTGEVTGVPLYNVQPDGRLAIPLSLNPASAVLLSVVPLTQSKPKYATASTAQALVYDTDLAIAVRATTAGTYSTTLDDGKTYSTKVETVFPAQALNTWTLNVEDWQPANGNGTTGNVSETRIVNHTLNLTSLAVWTSLPGLEDVSGIGTYSTTFTLGTSSVPLSQGMGAYFKVTNFGGSFRIKVNDEYIGPSDQLAFQFDIGEYVKNGTNTIEVELATTLLNRMKATYPDAYASKSRSQYGLIDASIQPYTQVTVA